MSKVCRYLSIAAFLFTLFTLTLTSTAFAQAPSPEPCPTGLASQNAINDFNKVAIQKDVFDDKVFNLNQITGTTDSLFTLLTGCSLIHPETNVATQGQGALAVAGKMLASLYGSPPASGVIYFAQQLQHLNPVQPVYAQTGIGYRALSPIQNIWTQFRNASYIGFVIIFVIIGFMIMFRAHISPQAVATVQDSLPRIVIALILVTFSYAIAGLMIDIMFLVLNIAINLIGLGPNSNIIFSQSIFGVIFSSWSEIFLKVSNAIAILIDGIFKDVAVLSNLIALLGGGIIGLIIGIALLFVMFRVFFMLLMAYVMIIILTIFAPFFFLFQALPGQNGATAWFKQMASNVSVFAVVGIMILLAALIGGIQALGGPAASPLGNQVTKFPLLTGGIDPNAIGKMIALGFIILTPGAAQMAKEFIGAKGPGFGGVAGATLGAAGGVVASPFRGAYGRLEEGRRVRASSNALGKAIARAQPPVARQTGQPGEGEQGP